MLYYHVMLYLRPPAGAREARVFPVVLDLDIGSNTQDLRSSSISSHGLLGRLSLLKSCCSFSFFFQSFYLARLSNLFLNRKRSKELIVF